MTEKCDNFVIGNVIIVNVMLISSTIVLRHT